MQLKKKPPVKPGHFQSWPARIRTSTNRTKTCRTTIILQAKLSPVDFSFGECKNKGNKKMFQKHFKCANGQLANVETIFFSSLTA